VPYDGKGLVEEICYIVRALEPCHSKVASVYLFAEPVVLHDHALGLTGALGIVGNANGTFIITEDVSRRLRIFESSEDATTVEAFFAADIGGGVFCLSGTDGYARDDVTDSKDCAVDLSR
jgi:hypothetical protein